MRDWTKENKRNPPVQFRVTRAEFAELRSAGWKRRPRVSAHGEAKIRFLSAPIVLERLRALVDHEPYADDQAISYLADAIPGWDDK